MELETKIKNRAFELGFNLVGITSALPIEKAHFDHLQTWISRGFHGPLGYMEKNLEKRTNPSALLPGARSVICVALHYQPLSADSPAPAKIASYAVYDDYHPFIKERLYQLAESIENWLPKPASWTFKAAVDSVPLAERYLAWRAGLGFIGRNHLLIHPQMGGSILLGELITTLDLKQDSPLRSEGCGDCRLCIQACPTGALGHDGTLDARRCISSLTQYENPDGLFPGRSPRSAWLFGCDECLNACPYTQKSAASNLAGFEPVERRKKINPEEILSWDQADFERVFGNSCLRRIGLEKLKQNAGICREIMQGKENSGH